MKSGHKKELIEPARLPSGIDNWMILWTKNVNPLTDKNKLYRNELVKHKSQRAKQL